MNAEIKKEKWESFLKTLNTRRYEWKTRIEVLSSEFGDQVLSAGLPLNGITMEVKGGKQKIGISVGENTERHQTHTILDPSRIAFLAADASHGDIVDIEQSDGTKTLITFIEPMDVMVGFAEVEMIAAPFKRLEGIMRGFKTAIESDAVANTNFRKVLYTSESSQLVLMSLLPGEDIGLETHERNDQFFRVEKGHGKCIIDGNEYGLSDGDAVVVPRGARHNVINLSATDELKLYTIYSPPHHKDGIVRATKIDAATNEEEFDGKTTEDLLTKGAAMFTPR